MPPLLTLGLLMLTGLAGGLLASRIGLPRVPAYILAGVLFSPAWLGGHLNVELQPWAGQVTTFALGLIAYLIGGSITWRQLQRAGRVIGTAALGEVAGAALLVFCAVYLAAPELPGVSATQLALAFAAISVTTAPAATVAVLHQFRARGPLATTLLGVVAIDDALGILAYTVLAAVATGGALWWLLGDAVVEILGAVALGALLGLGLTLGGHGVRQRSLRLSLVLGAVLTAVGVAQAAGLSPLLAGMVLGFTTRSVRREAGNQLFGPVEHYEEMFFVLFFTLAGAHFDLGTLGTNLPLLAVYVTARVAGKGIGGSLGARLAGAPPQVSRWLGPALIPQAGVAVGLALTLSHHPLYAAHAELVLNLILASTLFYEIVGPLATRYALQRAGELGPGRRSTRP